MNIYVHGVEPIRAGYIFLWCIKKLMVYRVISEPNVIYLCRDYLGHFITKKLNRNVH